MFLGLCNGDVPLGDAPQGEVFRFALPEPDTYQVRKRVEMGEFELTVSRVCGFFERVR